MERDGEPSGWDRRRGLRLTELELLAMEMFAERGYSNVTVDEIAAKAGVSARTLFRYFPVKEDILLGYVRRTMEDVVGRIRALPPSPRPLEMVWALLRDRFENGTAVAQTSNLWRAAAKDAPDVTARAIGERMRLLLDAVTEYCAASLGMDPVTDPRARLMAGPIVGTELAMVEAHGRSTEDWGLIVELGEQALGLRGGRSRARKPV